MKNRKGFAWAIVLALGISFALQGNAAAATITNVLVPSGYRFRVGDLVTLTDRVVLQGNDLPLNVTVRVTFFGRGVFNMWQQTGYRDIQVYVRQGQGGSALGNGTASIEFQMPRWTLGRAYFYTEARVIAYHGVRPTPYPISLKPNLQSNVVSVTVG